MKLKSDAKCEEKLICYFKNDKNLYITTGITRMTRIFMTSL